MTTDYAPKAQPRVHRQQRSRCLLHWRAADVGRGPAVSEQWPTFTRAGAGGLVPDALGVLVPSVHSLMRFGMYDLDGDGERETTALVMEPRNTNLCLRSQELGNAAWSPFNITVTSDARLAPDGTLTADDLVETAVTNAHYLSATVTVTAGSYCAYSAFVKQRSSTDRFRGMIAFENGADRVSATFRLDTLAVSTTALGAATITDSGIEAYADGWYRVWVTGRVNAASTSLTHWVRIFDDAGTASYLGDVTKGLSYWGAQLEVGALTPTTGCNVTSYLPTTSASVQRPTEEVKFTNGLPTAMVYNQLTLYVKLVRPLWYAHTGSLDEYAYLFFGGGNPRFGMSLARDSRLVQFSLSDSAATFASVSSITQPTGAAWELVLQMDQLFTAPRARGSVDGATFGAWSANALLPIYSWGSADWGLGGVLGSPQYNLRTGLVNLKLAVGLWTPQQMRELV